MRIAVPVWHDRVSPVFDVAGRLLLIDVEGDAEVRRSELAVAEQDPALRTGALVEHGVDVLICGAVSAALEAMLSEAGVRVVSQVCGDFEVVVAAFRRGALDGREFVMPGCCARRRQRRRCGRKSGQTGRRGQEQGDVS